MIFIIMFAFSLHTKILHKSNSGMQVHSITQCEDNACEICNCDCDHCTFGIGDRCDDYGIVQTCFYPVNGSVQKVIKRDIERLGQVEIKEFIRLCMLCERMNMRHENVYIEVLRILYQHPDFIYLTDDNGDSIFNKIRMN